MRKFRSILALLLIAALLPAALGEGELGIALVVIENLAGVGFVETYESLEEHGLTRATSTYDKVCLARLILNRYILQDGSAIEGFIYVFALNHIMFALTG